MSADHRVSGNACLDALQLDLFPETTEQAATRGISPQVARAGVGPGWWPIVDRLFALDGSLVVYICRDVDGVLDLSVSLTRDGEDPTWLAAYIKDVRANVSRTCACCGGPAAVRVRVRPDAPACVACEACRARLRAGESILRIAEDFWHLDGSRRLPPVTYRAAQAAQAARVTGVAAKTRECTALAPEELRAVVMEFRQNLREILAGQDHLTDRLAILAGLHVGGDLPVGARALLIGRSGTGKSTAIEALRRTLEEGHWDVPFVVTDGIDLSSPGWSGAPSIGDLIHAAIGEDSPDSVRARHAVVVIDEIHHIGMSHDLHGNMAAKRQEVLSSLLPLVGYGMLHLGAGTRQWSSRNALVLGVGAFSGLLDVDRTPTIRDLEKAGLPLELASRFEEVLTLRQFDEAALRAVLRTWPALLGLISVCERLGYRVKLHDEAISRAARAVHSGHDGATLRTAGGWLVAALRDALTSALHAPEVRELAITPDSLVIASASLRPVPPDEPPDPFGPWDATIVLRPR